MSDAKEPIWLSLELVRAAQVKQVEQFGGIHGIRDESLLESALARPHQLFHYGDPPPDLCSIAAAYAHGLVKNHAFLDGNKRIAHIAYRLFLAKNGLILEADQASKYTKMIQLAAGDITEEAFATWLRSVSQEA